MIFVTVGNALQGFPRLLHAIDALAQEGVFGDAPVILQVGHTRGAWSTRCTPIPFVSPEEFSRLLQDASLVVSHGGCGTIIAAVRAGKVPVVMPRRHAYGEHVNDHQLQLSRALAQEGLIQPAWEPTDLPHALHAAHGAVPRGTLPPPTMVGAVAGILAQYATRTDRRRDRHQ